jgi:hypothetical protein
MTEEQHRSLYTALVAIFITNLCSLFLLFLMAWPDIMRYLIHGLLRDLLLKIVAP